MIDDRLSYRHCAPNGAATTRWERGRPVRIAFADRTMITTEIFSRFALSADGTSALPAVKSISS